MEDGPKTAPWRGILTVEGVESGDGRMFAGNSLTWDEPPLPLMWQKETSHGGKSDVSVRVGSINKVFREPDPQGREGIFAIRGEGTLDLNNVDGLEVYRRMSEGNMRGNSVDVDSIKGADVELVFPESKTGPLAAAEGDSAPITQAFAEPELTVYKKGRIRASTMVEIPAFTEARLELMDEVITAATAARWMDELSDGIAEMERELELITAATSTINITDAPPREWFQEPTDVTATGALTITSEGRVYGYLAPAGVRHRSFGNKSVYVPVKNVDYSRFMGGETIVADGGRVATGAITMGCGHASTDYPLNASQAKDHYDNSCSLVATACVGENKHGVWIAGALLPDVTRAEVQRMMACRLSGDWRAHLDKSGWRELTAALLVPVPGFPMARSAPSVQMEGELLVASSVPVQFMDTRPTAREQALTISRRVKTQQLRARVSSFHGNHNQDSHGNWADTDADDYVKSVLNRVRTRQTSSPTIRRAKSTVNRVYEETGRTDEPDLNTRGGPKITQKDLDSVKAAHDLVKKAEARKNRKSLIDKIKSKVGGDGKKTPSATSAEPNKFGGMKPSPGITGGLTDNGMTVTNDPKRGIDGWPVPGRGKKDKQYYRDVLEYEDQRHGSEEDARPSITRMMTSEQAEEWGKDVADATDLFFG